MAQAQVSKINADFSKIETAAEVFDFFQAQGVTVEKAADVLSDGFEAVDNKRDLVGKDMALLSWTFSHSDKFDGEFVTVRAITTDNRKVRFSDGSSGIYAQLRELTTRREAEGHPYPQGALICNGLRVSDYTYQDDKGKKTAASTFYIAA